MQHKGMHFTHAGGTVVGHADQHIGFAQHGGQLAASAARQYHHGHVAFVGGFVNSVGFVLIGTFTSHVTGIIGRATNDLARAELEASGAASTMIFAFFFGAFVSSLFSGPIGRYRWHGLGIERDLLFEAQHPLSVYAAAARAAGSVVLGERRLAAAARRLSGRA